MLVVGDKEIADSTVSVRLRNNEQLPAQSLAEFKNMAKKIITGRESPEMRRENV
ncbi:hypothetical protein ACFLVJ_01180 [Chloroflexota bacterium]